MVQLSIIILGHMVRLVFDLRLNQRRSITRARFLGSTALSREGDGQWHMAQHEGPVRVVGGLGYSRGNNAEPASYHNSGVYPLRRRERH